MEEKLGPGLWQAQKYGGIKPAYKIPTLPISNVYTYIKTITFKLILYFNHLETWAKVIYVNGRNKTIKILGEKNVFGSNLLLFSTFGVSNW